MLDNVAVVGASVAGLHFVRALRKEGYDGRITLIGGEDTLPYDRPPLSKEFLRGEKQEEDIRLADEAFYAEASVDLLLGTWVERVEPGRLILSHGREVLWERLFLAPGAHLRHLDVPGRELQGIHYLRTLGSARRLRQDLQAAERLVVVGAGFIGLEVAASAAMLGKDVTVLEAADRPLPGALGPKAAQAVTRLHAEHGVRIVSGAKVERFLGDGRVRAVQAQGMDPVPCDLVVVGVGVAPTTRFLVASGLAINDGIVVGPTLETDWSGVFAGGDAARFPYRGQHIRVEHWEVAAKTAEHAARAMLGATDPYETPPYFWSDQYDTTLQYFGHAPEWDEEVLRGSPEEGDVAAFYLRHGQVVATFLLGQGQEAVACRRLVERGAHVEPRVLADPNTDLQALAKTMGK